MKLFVWENVLCDYTCGIMFAYAENVDKAKEIILTTTDAFTGDYKNFKLWQEDKDSYKGYIPDMWVELEEEPDIHDSEIGYAVWGGG